MRALWWVSPVLAVVLAAGPLGPMVAAAQAPPTQTPAPAPGPAPGQSPAPAQPSPPVQAPAPMQPPAPVQPPPTVQTPPVTSYSATTPLQPMVSMQPDTLVEGNVSPPGTGAKIGAGVLNVVYVPGKAIVCGAGTIVAGVFMLATFGSAHREATSFFKEGCSGAWLITPEQVAAAPSKVQLERGY